MNSAGLPGARSLAIEHWNATPLFVSAEERYGIYPWLPAVAEFGAHAGEKVLEVGCGTGCDLLQFAEGGANATGIDITPAHLELAKQRVQGRAAVQYGDGTDIPFADGTFDYVYSHGVLHHSDAPETFAREIMRVLQPGGRFNVHVYALFSYFTLWRMLRRGRRWRLYIENSTAPVHIDLYTRRRLRRLFPQATEVTISRRHAPFAPALWGWYLIIKGRKPR